MGWKGGNVDLALTRLAQPCPAVVKETNSIILPLPLLPFPPFLPFLPQ